nr:MAG TPA: tail protein [Caudoviricetes sp.]
MAIEVYNGESPKTTLRSVCAATLTDKLSGEMSFSFTTLLDRAAEMDIGDTVRFQNRLFSIVSVEKKLSGGLPLATFLCEPLSYELNNEIYDLVAFVFTGTPGEGLTELLSGTGYTVGTVEETAEVECAFTDGTLTRRSALLRFADACGCELEFENKTVHFRKHRGSATAIELMDGRNVSDLSVSTDGRAGTESYQITLYKRVDLSVGDELHIVFSPMNLDVETRIVGIEYNPFNPYEVSIEVGDYVPNMLAHNADRLQKAKQEFRAADGRMQSSIDNLSGNVSTLTQTVSGFDFRITTAENSVASLALSVSGFETRIVSAENAVTQMSSRISQLATEISLVISDGGINSASIIAAINEDTSSIVLSANKIDLVSVAEDAAETVADGLSLSVKNSSASSSIKLKYGTLLLSSATISFSGMVTFSDLSTSGSTTINGDNITTGSIDADLINTNTLACTKIYAKNYSSGYFARLNGSWGDFGIFTPSATSSTYANSSKCMWGIYQSDPTTQAVNFFVYGNNFAGYNGSQKIYYPKGVWDFSNATVRGI